MNAVTGGQSTQRMDWRIIKIFLASQCGWIDFLGEQRRVEKYSSINYGLAGKTRNVVGTTAT